MKKKTICFSLACYNEKDNIEKLAGDLLEICKNELQEYRCILQFIDNCSNDGTREKIRKLCEEHAEIRAILNAKNFPLTSGYYNIMQTEGTCTIALPCDFQVPLQLIPNLVKSWENGAKIVCLVKKSSEESKIMYRVRKLFYKLSNAASDTEILAGFSGYGLYDKAFLDICRSIDDSEVSFAQMVSTLGYDIDKLTYREQKRKHGKSKNTLWSLFDIAILRFTNSSNIGPRIATLAGFALGLISILIGLVYLILKIIFWESFSMGVAPLVFGVFFMGGIQLFFTGLIGEYVIKVNKRLMKRPLVVELERLNFEKSEGDEEE